jgi:hypothetical protein
MSIRPTRFFSALVPALFCTIAFSSALADAGQASSFRESVTQKPLQLAEADKVYVCKINKNGHMETLYIPKETYEKQAAQNPNEYLLGKCEEVISPSS